MPVLDLYSELAAIVAALEGRGIPYALCGAVALAAHGRPRATTDVDLLIEPASLETAKTLLRGLGYDLEAAPMTFSSGITVHDVSRVEGRELVMIDLLLAEGPLVEVWNGRVRLPWEERSISVVSREGLVAMKRLADRPQDRADLVALGEDGDE